MFGLHAISVLKLGNEMSKDFAYILSFSLLLPIHSIVRYSD